MQGGATRLRTHELTSLNIKFGSQEVIEVKKRPDEFTNLGKKSE